MGIFDLLLDELAKEIKEAPGWISLVIVCNLLLLLPSVHRGAESLGIDIGEDQGTVATLLAIVLFFLGDALDTLVFPRKKDTRRAEKLLQSVMLSLAAWGFFLFVRREWVWGACIWAVWAFLFPLHNTLKKSREKTVARNVEATAPEKEKRSGLEWLEPGDLEVWRKEAEKRLSVSDGVYAVSKSLARAADMYNLSWIQIQNESAKFIRSTVLPAGAAGGLLLFRAQWFWAAFAFLSAVALEVLYGRLKGWHMRRLYKLVVQRIVTSTGAFSTTDLANGFRVFYWNGDVIIARKRIIAAVPTG